jgi:hypothetical protein
MTFKQKYLKYKIKYIDLKNQIGGMLGTDPCPEKFDEHNPPSILECLEKYNCKYAELNQKNPLQMSKFNYDQYQKNFQNKKTRITMIELRSRGFPLSIFIERGFPLKNIIEANFSLHELKQAGFSAKALGDYYLLTDLLTVGFTVKEIADARFSLHKIRQAGITALQLRQAGVLAHNIRNLGFTLEELRATGITVAELKSEDYPLKKIRELGFTLLDLLNGGYKFDEIKQLKYNLQELLDTGINLKILRDMGYSYSEIGGFGFSAQQIFENGATLEEMIQARYNLNVIHTFFPLEQLKQKFDIRSLRDYFSLEDLIRVGFKLPALKYARFSALNLKHVGYTLPELIAVRFSPIELRSAFINEINQNPELERLLKPREFTSHIRELQKFGYTANDLKEAGYNALQLYKDFRLSDLQRAGYTDRELKSLLNPHDKTLSVIGLCNFGFTAEDFKNAGYDAGELHNCFSLFVLRNAGYTDDELRKPRFGAWNFQ